MENKRFLPKCDKLFHCIWIPTAVLMLGLLVMSFITGAGWIITLLSTLFVAYFIISPLFGYVELREKSVFVKFGFFMKREIPYEKIRGVEKKRTVIADSMMSLKNAMDHVNIKYNSFDVISVSVKDEEAFVKDLKSRCST